MTANVLTCVPGNKLSGDLVGFVSCLGFCYLLLVSAVFMLLFIYAMCLLERGRRAQISGDCSVMSQGIRNKNRVPKQVRIKIVNCRGQDKT